MNFKHMLDFVMFVEQSSKRAQLCTLAMSKSLLRKNLNKTQNNPHSKHFMSQQITELSFTCKKMPHPNQSWFCKKFWSD